MKGRDYLGKLTIETKLVCISLYASLFSLVSA